MSSLLDMLEGGTSEAAPRCSRAGCRERATAALRWRNPRIHSTDREKIWLACPEHVDYLREFLSSRSFPVAETALADDATPGATPGAAR
ncbi:hypothetical protein [uncultured Microbacterium sp.]|uniref:hypothetical protein n=1 Tax=uncultured Microbacterium sp. TaxID=191216 RepID=UPI0025F5E265|nr:hypothetical protein [uncultured Microbacterium sp.]